MVTGFHPYPIVLGLAINVIWFRPFDVRIFYDKVFVEFALEYPELLSSMGYYRALVAETSCSATDQCR